MNIFRSIFNKPNSEDYEIEVPSDNFSFVIKIESLIIGFLRVKEGLWTFEYSNDFKNQNKYHRLVGFSDLNKTYESSTLWPFFKVRIPGLKQPIIKEILKKENIDHKDEVALLKRFGRINISNPYILEFLF